MTFPFFYAEAHYLSPFHCRLCLADLATTCDAGCPDRDGDVSSDLHTRETEVGDHASDAASASDVDGRLDRARGVPPGRRSRETRVDEHTDDDDDASGSARDEDQHADTKMPLKPQQQELLDARVAKHVQDVHGLSPQEYRREVLRRTVAEWPQPITAQVIRTVLTSYKKAQSDALFQESACASCARLTPLCELEVVEFPERASPQPPAWLGWEASEWAQCGPTWYDQVAALLSTERYLQTYFEADKNVDAANQELVDAECAVPPVACVITEKRAWHARVQQWRDNLRTSLLDDGVPAPGNAGARWLLFVPEHKANLGSDDAPPIVCRLCRQCRLPLSHKTQSRQPAVAMPRASRARGLWGGPLPPEMAALTPVERRVVAMGRVCVVVNRVHESKCRWARNHPEAAPRYTYGNMVAYPQDEEQMVLKTICLMPEELCQVVLVQFIGNDLSGVARSPAHVVSVPRLRAAMWWLATNNWPWMVATKHSGIGFDPDALGSRLERVLAAYRNSIPDGVEGVPRELVDTATTIDAAHAPRMRAGPADAADSEAEGSGDEGKSARVAFVDASAAVVDTGFDTVTPLRLWSNAMKKYKVLEECAGIVESVDAQNDPDAVAQAQREEATAIGEAVQELSRLASRETRAKLAEFSAQVDGTGVVLKVPRGDRYLSSFDEYFWAHCFVDLFCRGDCREKYAQHEGSLQTKGKTLIRILLMRGDFPRWSKSLEFAASVYNILMRRAQLWAVYRYVNFNKNFAENTKLFEELTAQFLCILAPVIFSYFELYCSSPMYVLR